MQIAFLGVVMGMSGVFMAVLFKRRQSMGVLQLRRVSVKMFAVLFGSLLIIMVFLPLVETANASSAGVIWGSRSTGAPNGFNSYSWRKTDREFGNQSSVQNYLSNNCFISANGYAGFPSIEVNKAAILYQAQYLSSNYDHVSVVDFDHGVIGYLGTVPSSNIPSGEAHYMFEDDWGTVVGSISSNYNDFSHGVFDADVYDVFPAGKVNFAFINTCLSANIWNLGQGFSSSGNPLSLPFAFTHRMTDYVPSGSTATTMSVNGYTTPDAFPQCYIGFPYGSAALEQKIPYDNGSPQWYQWVIFFFYKALNDNVSVKGALNWASDMQWSGKDFGTSCLYTGFSAAWPMWKIVNGQPEEVVEPVTNCTLVVYGNSNICLRNFVAPHMVTWPSVSSTWSGAVGSAVNFNVYSVDSYGHRIRYIFDWGDGTQTVTGYTTAGVSVSVPHVWSTSGLYNVRVYAQCENGVSSSWSPNYGVVIGNLYWLEIDTSTNQVNRPYVNVWVDGVWVGISPLYCLVSEGWHSVEVDEDVDCWEFVEMSDGYANGVNRPIYSDTQLNAIYFGW
ncbi:MAG: hypothetical protein LBQ98_04950 [Nitrososphaerota archaeon]|jgi:hypothetical protein|nr:hypothetical protein [Nitrososphaerota archaeon]